MSIDDDKAVEWWLQAARYADVCDVISVLNFPMSRNGEPSGSMQAMNALGHFYMTSTRPVLQSDPLVLRKPVCNLAAL